jgi:hypothetical protein
MLNTISPQFLPSLQPLQTAPTVKLPADPRTCHHSIFITCPINIFVYYESIKREIKRRLIYEYRCDERLKTKNEESTRLTDTGLVGELEHLKTKTRLIDEKFVRKL